MTVSTITSTRRLLWKAIEYFEKHPNRHTTRALARNSYGDKVSPLFPHATCWCAIGLLLKLGEVDTITGDVEVALGLMQKVASARGHASVKRCSDVEGQAGAVAMLRGAVANLDAKYPHAAAAA